MPIVLSSTLTLAQYLRLYVTVYQSPNIWKDLWKMQLPHLSPQIAKDCETFVSSYPFNAVRVMELIAT
jgi:hypothetical protein